MQMAILKSVIEQHAEEAAFLWLQRDIALREPHYSLKDLVQLDERIEANIDGLRIAGAGGWEISREALLAMREPGEVYTAAMLAFEADNGSRVDEVISVAQKTPENWRALVSATGWLSDEHYQRWVPGMLNSNAPCYRHLAIMASIIHRQDSGSSLITAIDDPDPSVQARALRGVGELKRHDLLPLLHAQFKADDIACQFWAAWSAVLLGEQAALDVLKVFTNSDTLFRGPALHLVLRVLDVSSATKWLHEFTQSPDVLRYALLGAGIIGDPLYVPWLIKLMSIPEVSRIAGETFSMITGVDLAYDDLEGEWPAGFTAGPTENPQDDDVAMDPDEDLPWPAQDLIKTWWQENSNHFQLGTRYLVGKPITAEHCQQVLQTGLQRQRRAAALELAVLQADTRLFNTSAPGFRQQQLRNYSD